MTGAGFTPGAVVRAAQEAPTHAREARTTSPVRIVLRKIIVAPVNTLSSSFHARALGRSQTLDSRVHFGQQTQYEAEARIVSRVKSKHHTADRGARPRRAVLQSSREQPGARRDRVWTC